MKRVSSTDRHARGALYVAATAVAAIGLPLLVAASPASGTTAMATVAERVGEHANRGRSAAAERTRPVRGSGSISGIVLGPGGLPVAGACVSVVGSARSLTTTAAPDGRFAITGLAAGSYVLAYSDCADPARYLTTWSGGALSRRAAAHVVVRAAQTRGVPVMTLRPSGPAAILQGVASWHRALAAASARLTAAAAARTGEITGTVTGAGRALRGICVRAGSLSGSFGYAARTGKSGQYTMRNVHPGRYYVVFELSDYGPVRSCQDAGNWLEQWYRGLDSPYGTGAQAVGVGSGKTTAGIDAKLVRGGQISGRVSTKSGKGLHGICIIGAAQLPGNNTQVLVSSTGRDGIYFLHGLYPGGYSLSFSTGCNYDGNYAPAGAPSVRLRRGQHRTVNVRLAAGGIVAGTVRLGSKSGRPLAGICVTDGEGTQATTGAGGHYRVNGLGTGSVQLYFSAGCGNNGNYLPATVTTRATEGKVRGGANAVLQPAAQIYGKVTNSAGTGLSGMCIDFTGVLPPSLYFGTNGSGTYRISQLPAGTYELGFSSGCGNSGNYAPYWYDNEEDPSLATPIVVARASSHVINARLQLGGELTGTVTDSHGDRLSGVCVAAATQFAAPPASYHESASSYRGQFHLSGLEPGQYLVDFGCEAGGSYGDQWFDRAPSAATAEVVSVTAGQTSHISAVLRPGGIASGVVTGTSGRPLGGICVQPFSTVGRTHAAAGATGTANVPTTNSHGAYRITGLAPGNYDVEFYPCGTNPRYAAQWYLGQVAQSSATAVRVRAGATTTGVDARLAVGGTVSGRAVTASGKPVSGLCVYAFSSGGPQAVSSTGPDGRYTIEGLSSGSYTVMFNPWQANDQVLTALTTPTCDPGLDLVPVSVRVKVTAPRASTGVNASMLPGGSVSGLITTAGSSKLPVANECVEVYGAGSGTASVSAIGLSGVDGFGGPYVVTGLAPGTYTVYFGDPFCGFGPPDLVPQWYDGQPSQADATTITITAGHTTSGIDAALQTTGEITGTVRGPGGAAVSGGCVTAYPAGSGAYPILAVSRRGGEYALIDLPPGRYRIEFSSGCGATGYRSQWWQDARSAGAATVIQVAAGQVVVGIGATLSR
jgi:Carboxypeptidase regulatory-like domain